MKFLKFQKIEILIEIVCDKYLHRKSKIVVEYYVNATKNSYSYTEIFLTSTYALNKI